MILGVIVETSLPQDVGEDFVFQGLDSQFTQPSGMLQMLQWHIAVVLRPTVVGEQTAHKGFRLVCRQGKILL